MGINLKDIVLKHVIQLEDLNGKKIAIDAFNIIFQFLSTIRQRDGTPLTDSHGNVTSHLSGIFYRTINLMEAGVKPCFVFDGSAPPEKKTVQEEREKIREEARKKHAEALARGDIEEARKYAQQTSRLTGEMIRESKELVSAMGLPWIQALAEGEAQAALMCRKGHVWAVVSQDYDSVLFGASRLVRNLSISAKKKVAGTEAYKKTDIELIDTAETLNFLGIDISKLVDLALLVGTDYNPGGVQGIGPKTALKVVRENKFDEYIPQIANYERLRNMFLKPAVTTDYTLTWTKPDETKIIEILCGKHEFSEQRVKATLKRIEQAAFENQQEGLGKFV